MTPSGPRGRCVDGEDRQSPSSDHRNHVPHAPMPKRRRATRATLPTRHVRATALAAGALAAGALILAAGCRPSASGTPSPAPGAAARVPNDPPAALGADEARLRDAVRARYDDAVALLARAVDIPSGTHNVAGVRRVGELFAKELQAIGFETRWVALPDEMRRAGHLVAERRGARGPRLLLIG